MNYLQSLYNWFYQSVEEEKEEKEKDVLLNSVDETCYNKLLNTKIRRLIVNYSSINRLNSLADDYGKLNCEICTIVYYPYELQVKLLQDTYSRTGSKTCRTDGPSIRLYNYSEYILPMSVDYKNEIITPRFVNTRIIDMCHEAYAKANPNSYSGELVKFEIDIEANVYVGCKPVSESRSIILSRMTNGGILDPDGKLITIFETLDLLNCRFAKTKSAKN